MAGSDEELGTCLRAIRLQRPFTQAALAGMVGVSRQTINYIEQGSYAPSTTLALKLARVLGVTVEDLFYLHDTWKAEPSACGRDPLENHSEVNHERAL